MVANTPKNNGSEEAARELRYDFGPEVGTNRVHVVIGFSQKHRSLVREDQNNVLNSTEANTHCDEKQSTVSILDSS